jgi:hypothetical protein
MESGPFVVEATSSALVALLVAPLTGLLVLVVRMLGRSGKVRGSLGVLLRSRADLATLAVYDIVGGGLCVASVIILGITRPPALIAGFEDQPVLAWAIVGALGPLVSAGIVDRLPLRTFADFFASQEQHKNEKADKSAVVIAEVRLQASQRILLRLYEEVRVVEALERDSHASRARRLISEGELSFSDVVTEVNRFSGMWRERVPSEVRVVIRKHGGGSDLPPADATIKLVHTCLETGFVRPVAIATRIAEARRSG